MSIQLNERYDLALPFSVLAAEGLGKFEFDGYASAFGSVNSYGFTIDAGAFAKTLKENPNPVILWQHNPDMPIGTIIAAEEDKKGLKIRGKLVEESRQAQEAHALMMADAIRGMSIGFQVLKSSYEREKGLDHVTELRLMEVSLVTFPSDPKARVSRVLSELREIASERAGNGSPADIDSTLTQLRALLTGAEPGVTPTQSEDEPRYTELIAQVRELNLALKGLL